MLEPLPEVGLEPRLAMASIYYGLRLASMLRL